MQDFANGIEQAKSSAENRRSYAWGEEADLAKMNFRETGIRSTSAVGAFPAGVSLFGCEDMSGNVWEWTMTKWTSDYTDYDLEVDNRPDGSETRRVLRGGAFRSSDNVARCAYRNVSNPAYDYADLGFRVVASLIQP
jgi:formylglycine-generating enzyme required for sulfatase activity